jgi:hypothetical protein
MSGIDRVRYYDGEFLRAFDFSDEQTYHVEMRRRLNRYLHLYGIVQGLQLSEDIQGTGVNAVHQVSILPGFAIDAFGREIYVFAPYTLGDADIAANRIANPGNYDVWLRYNKIPSTPPSSGYSACNQPNEYTRWIESFSVVLLAKGTKPFTPPAFTDDDADTPGQDAVGILLGTVLVDPSSATAQFSAPTFDNRLSFIRIIAQSIQAPIPYDAKPSYNFQLQNNSLSPICSLEIQPNIFADQNLIVGPDFDLTTNPKPPNPTPSTNKVGNTKIASDLFVQGNIYSQATVSGQQQWLGLSPFIQQLVQQSLPDIQVPVPVNQKVPLTNAGLVSGTTPVQATSKIATVKSFIAIAYLFGIQYDTQTNIASLPGSDQIQLVINTITQIPPVGNICTINVNWTAGPVDAAKTFSAINNFWISSLFFCFP